MLENARRSRQKLEVKQKIREAERKRQFKSSGKKQDPDPPEDDDPRLECTPIPWNFAAQIDWEGDVD
ncbi:hypothetical protein CEXT_642851 [Caerostris extrusa]|uniref:Uncharacterized protein n=1 Tax=Caerostris extrusa TaxID=172846 RepID=A0AAV4XKZ9_CAEEX|nr:hypothetical protein CEXT_642851 [Caerostris extrusa]